MVATLRYKNADGTLTEKIKRICDDYVAGQGSFRVCMRNVYSADVTSTNYKVVFDDPDVQAYIKSMNEQAQSVAIASAQEILLFWTDLMKDSEQKSGDRLTASRLLAQHFGLMDKDRKDEKEKDPFVIDIMPMEVLPPEKKLELKHGHR